MTVVSAPKFDIDTVEKIISLTISPVLEGSDLVVDFDIQIDLYSDMKEIWVSNEVLRKVRFPVSSVGGNDLPGSKVLGDTYFIDPEWKIRPYEGSHRFRVNGNFYSTDGSSPFIATTGSHNVFMEHQVSNLVDSTVQQLPEIEYASFGGHVTLDETATTSGTDYPFGTPRQPVNNLTDAMIIASGRGFSELFIVGDALIDNGGDYTGMTFTGESMTKSVLTVSSAANVVRAEFYEAHMAGTLDGEALLNHCILDNLDYVSGKVENCVLEAGVIQLGGNVQADFLNCWSGEAGSGSPCIDCGGSGQSLTVRNYSGGLLLTNKTGMTDKVSVDLISGQVKVDLTTVTAGEIVIRGVGKVVDYATGKWLPSGTYGNLTLTNETLFGQMLQEVHQILELDKNNPVTAGPDGISTNDINIAFTDNGDGTKTAMRQ